METKKLYRSETDKMIGGVCGGLAEYFNIDSTIIRLAFVIMGLLGGHGVLVYLVLLLLIPPAPVSNYPSQPVQTPPPTHSEDQPPL